MKQLYHDGLIAHFSSVYNHMDFCMLKFYLASLTLRFTTYLKVSISRSLTVYNHMDFCMLKFYLASLTLRFTTYLKVSISRSFTVYNHTF